MSNSWESTRFEAAWPSRDRRSGCARPGTRPCPEADSSGAPSLGDIRYSQSWEDPEVDRRALDIGPEDDVLTIAASGDNALAFLLDEPRSLTAIDLDLAQCCLMELKVAAIERFSHGELLEFVGASPSRERRRTYRRIRDALSAPARSFWDEHPEWIERGVIHVGRLERFFALFRRILLPWVHSPAARDALFRCRTLEEQRSFYHSRWDGVRWRLLFRVFFNRTVMARFGRDPGTFRYVEGDVASAIRERARSGLAGTLAAGNWFLGYILYGNYDAAAALPPYLREDNHPRLRRLLPRVAIVHEEVEQFLVGCHEGAFHKYCLSDIFEYMSEETADRLFGELWRVSSGGAVLSYREMMVPRVPPAALSGKLVQESELGAWCHRHDRTFFYGAHHVLRVQGKPSAPRLAQPATEVRR